MKINLFNKKSLSSTTSSVMMNMPKAQWTSRSYAAFADEGYRRNVVVFRSVNLVANSVSGLKLSVKNYAGQEVFTKGLSLLNEPNPFDSGKEFMEKIVCYKLLAGNCFILALKAKNGEVMELHLLRPDKVSMQMEKGVLTGFVYGKKLYPINNITGECDILHLKSFNPLDEYCGMSPVEAASFSIDQHNQAMQWNQALLQNGAKPSGMLVSTGKTLSDSQRDSLKQQLDEFYSSPKNAGRPMILEGGLEWREMSLSPKDMDFLECKNSSARDIAGAFGVPPQLLGIQGDGTYSNYAEARLAFKEHTIYPLTENILGNLTGWLTHLKLLNKGEYISFDDAGK
jgi:HK97 family phage portal protein